MYQLYVSLFFVQLQCLWLQLHLTFCYDVTLLLLVTKRYCHPTFKTLLVSSFIQSLLHQTFATDPRAVCQ